MAGRNQADFRSGNWNEELGVLLLKTLAAVAPVSRQDDFGLDAVATLLRKHRSDGCLYAEESFYVQFKSAGRRPIIYREHEIEWLRALQLPFFIGSVEKKTQKLELFPAHNLANVFIGLARFTEVKVRPGVQRSGRNRDGHRAVFLGPPLLSIAMGDLLDAEHSERAYRLLKDFLQLEQRNITARRARFVTRLKWSTNKSVEITGSAHTLSRARRKEELLHACETMVPGLRLAEMYAESTEDDELGNAIARLMGRLKRIFAEKEFVDEGKRPAQITPTHSRGWAEHRINMWEHLRKVIDPIDERGRGRICAS